MTKDIYSMGWIKRMPKASKVDRSEAEFIPSTTPSGSNIITTNYFYKPDIPSGLNINKNATK